MFSEVTSNGTMGSFGFNSTIGGHEDGGHQTEGAVTLGNGIGLDITIVVLAGPNETTIGFHHVGNHIVDESVFVPESLGFEFFLVILLVDALEDILESTVVSLQNGVLSGQVEGVVSAQSVFETCVSEVNDGLIY